MGDQSMTVEELTQAERKFLNAIISTVRGCYLDSVRKPDTTFSGIQIFFEGQRPKVRPIVDYYPTESQ